MDTTVLWSEPSICEKVGKEPIGEGFATLSRGICYEQVAKTGYEDFSICEKVPQGDYGQEGCWFDVMNTKIACIKGEPPCPWSTYGAVEVINEYEKEAVATQDESKCTSISSTLSREGGYAIVAVKKADKTICENIQTAALKNQCDNFVDSTKQSVGSSES